MLLRLIMEKGHWIDGPELANEKVGGSEGLKRLRELRAEGHQIQERKHPDPDRDIWQYRITIPKREAIPAVIDEIYPRRIWDTNDPEWRP